MRSRLVLYATGACSLLVVLGLPPVALGEQGSPGTVVGIGEPDRLEAALEAHGWQVERDSEGALLVYPRSAGPAAEMAADPLHEAQAFPEASGEWVESGDLEGLQQALEAQGWQVQRNADGDLIVFPPEAAGGGSESTPLPVQEVVPAFSTVVDEAFTPPAGTVVESLSDAIDAADLDRLQEVAAERGWAHSREPDGSLVLYPPGLARGGEGSVPCQIGMIRIDGTETIGLPVDTEEKAARVAGLWLQESGGVSLAVGRARQVNRLQIVSIVERDPPFYLHTQLVIRSGDGCLIAISR